MTEDVYGANPLEPSTILQRGAVTETLDPDSAEVAAKNDPMQPLTWIREFKNEAGNTNKIFTTTMGASTGLLDDCLLYTSPSPRDSCASRMPSSA